MLETSQIDKVIREGRELVYAPAHPTRVNRDRRPDEDSTEPGMSGVIAKYSASPE